MDKFNNTYLNLNDIFSLNNQTFSKYTANIYPKEFHLNKSNVNNNNSPFLELYILVLNGNLHTKI